MKKEGKEDGEKDGAKFYKSGDSEVAVQDGTLIVAGNRKQLEAAIERHGGDDHFTQDDFDKGLGDVSGDSLVRAYFNVAALLDVRSEHGGRAQDQVGRRARGHRPRRLGHAPTRSTSTSTLRRSPA